VSKESEYLDNAAETLDLAKRVSSSPGKGRLLRLAEKWVDLADRVGRLSRCEDPETRLHPLVAQRLRNPRPDLPSLKQRGDWALTRA
jgi:hypothetical protein